MCSCASFICVGFVVDGFGGDRERDGLFGQPGWGLLWCERGSIDWGGATRHRRVGEHDGDRHCEEIEDAHSDLDAVISSPSAS